MNKLTKYVVTLAVAMFSSGAFANDPFADCPNTKWPEIKLLLVSIGLNPKITGCFEDRGSVLGFTTNTGGTHYFRKGTDYVLTIDKNNKVVQCGHVELDDKLRPYSRQIHMEACTELFGFVDFKGRATR